MNNPPSPMTVDQTRVVAEQPEFLANGLILAMHCVPASADPAIEAFWSALSKALEERGHFLVLLSTTAVADPKLHVLEIPFELSLFSRTYSKQAPAGIPVREQTINDAVSWYGCTYDEALNSLQVASSYLNDMLDALRPVVVLGWQSLNPLTRLLRELTLSESIPFWAAERGWLRNTLMFDVGGAHLLSEVSTSFAVSRQRREYQASEKILKKLQERAGQYQELNRYAQVSRLSREELRVKYGIPVDAPVAVLFTHGEPGMNAMAAVSVREIHDLSAEKIQHRVDALSTELLGRGFYFLVQEHPFNEPAGRTLRLQSSPRLITVQENVSSLVDAADCYFFTLSTLQFDVVFLDKPIGLLSRSALYVDGNPPFIGDHATVESYVDDLLDLKAWPTRWLCLRRHVAFLYEYLLLDLEDPLNLSSVSEWADHMVQFHRHVDGEFGDRIKSFLKSWKAH